MRPNKFSTATIQEILKEKKCVTIDELKKVLGTSADRTVLRKLKELPYYSSYTHRGKFYTIEKVTSFDTSGLWSHGFKRFSKHGTLIKTAHVFVEKSDKGYSVRELGIILKVEVKEPLLQLFKKGIIDRKRISNFYVYFSSNRSKQRKQIQRRKNQEEYMPVSSVTPEPKVLAHELKAAIIIFFSLLDEKQRRFYAALESMKFGHGGDQKISELLGLAPHTVAKGREELLGKDDGVGTQRVREKGGGRETILKKNP